VSVTESGGDRGMSIGAVGCHKSINKSMTHYINKNEDKITRSINTSATSSVKINLCKTGLFQKTRPIHTFISKNEKTSLGSKSQ
jgi:hypothetical protein